MAEFHAIFFYFPVLHDVACPEHKFETAAGGPCALSPSAGSGAEEESDSCCICMDGPKNVVFLPCRHLCCCQGCGPLCKLCPICRLASRILWPRYHEWPLLADNTCVVAPMGWPPHHQTRWHLWLHSRFVVSVYEQQSDTYLWCGGTLLPQASVDNYWQVWHLCCVTCPCGRSYVSVLFLQFRSGLLSFVLICRSHLHRNSLIARFICGLSCFFPMNFCAWKHSCSGFINGVHAIFFIFFSLSTPFSLLCCCIWTYKF